jgi:hypothetical protein
MNVESGMMLSAGEMTLEKEPAQIKGISSGYFGIRKEREMQMY